MYMLGKIQTMVNEEDVSQFLAGVGNRVRKERRAAKLSRRALSESSGVSERYLAQLETGSGNISLTILYRIAIALEKEPQWFLLATETNSRKAQRICLLGLRGAGKSTLGRYIAEQLSYKFIELNHAIESHSGMAISELMALYGQEGYRKLEGQAIRAIIESNSKVILAAAGGVVSEAETLDAVLSSFHTVWLKASPEEHMQRVRDQGDVRPMAGNPRAMEDLKSILTNREALYARADIMVDTSGKPLEDSQSELLSMVKRLQT